MILVTGASGTAGGATLDALRILDAPVKALYRSLDSAKNAPAGVTAAIGDYGDESLSAALKGVDKVFLVCGPVPDLVKLESIAIDGCAEAGVKHLVLFSALGAGRYRKSFPAWHTQVEAKLKSSGLAYTILRPNSFMQHVITYFAPTIRTQSAFYGCMREAKVSLVDIRNVGEFAAKTLTTSGHEGKTYELNGPEAFTYAEVASLISSMVGRQVNYVDLTPDQIRQSLLSTGMPQWQADALVDLQAYYTEGGGGDIDDGTIARVIGHPQTQLRDFIAENRNEFTSQAMSA